MNTDVAVGMTLYSLAIGAASGYFDYVLTEGQAAPKWWYAFVEWWKPRFFNGKPWTCSICLAFWLPVIAWLAALLLGCVTFSNSIIFFTGSSFAVALTIEKILARMDIVSL